MLYDTCNAMDNQRIGPVQLAATIYLLYCHLKPLICDYSMKSERTER
jgi:hypothetical protein